MSALTSREAARERVRKVFEGALERMMPADESAPLRGSRFIDFEDQVEALAREVLPVLLEERAALEGAAHSERPGVCPCCGSGRVYMRQEVVQQELASPHGPVVLRKQRARCRACGKTFSPSGS